MWVLAWYHVRSGMFESLRKITAPHNRITEKDRSPDWRKWVLVTISPSRNDRGAPLRSNTAHLASWNEIYEQNWRTSLLKWSNQSLLDDFGIINHYFLNFENKTCSRVALEFWKTRLASGMHTSRGLPKELILDLFKMARLYEGRFKKKVLTWLFGTKSVALAVGETRSQIQAHLRLEHIHPEGFPVG